MPVVNPEHVREAADHLKCERASMDEAIRTARRQAHIAGLVNSGGVDFWNAVADVLVAEKASR